ncbi:MAG TPA: diacylglycerol kinase family protein [Thermoanaerobaculia bacterium]|jgi:YegS/Rv2252/BmrU family lipid kinase|nr:diacylglycerol kinase family protein [Thermoanaerobaculia bacterium]
MKHGVLIYNPTAGQRDRAAKMQELIARLCEKGLDLVHAPTTAPGHATEIVRRLLGEGLDVVVVCGGDGTVSEAACGLVGSSVPLAILPGGTSNVLARELSIPLNLEGAARLLLEGVPRKVRVLYANDRPFLLWAGVGLDARIMGHMSLVLKRWLGRTGIFFTVADEFFRYEFPRLEVTVDGERHEATFAVVCHARHYAGPWVIAPEARLDSDEMEVLLFSGRRRWPFLSLFRQMQIGRGGHIDRGLARVIRGRAATIRSLESYPVEVQVDGDCVLETPLTCRVGTETISILVPRDGEQ